MVARGSTTDCSATMDQLAQVARLWCGLLNAPRLYPAQHPARQTAALQTAAALASIAQMPVTLGFGPRHMLLNGDEYSAGGAVEVSEALHQLGLAQIAFLSRPLPESLDAIAQVIYDARVGAPARDLAAAIEAAARKSVRCITVPDAARNLVAGSAGGAPGVGGWSAVLKSIACLSGGEGGCETVTHVSAAVQSAFESQLSCDSPGPVQPGFDAASLVEAIHSDGDAGPASEAFRATVRECLAKTPAEKLESLLRLDEFVGTATTGKLDALADVLPVDLMIATLERAADTLHPSDEMFMLLAKLTSFSVDEGGARRLLRVAEHVSAESETDASAWRAAVHDLLRSRGRACSYTPGDYTALLKRSAASAVAADPALHRMIRDAWSSPLLQKARVTIDLLKLTTDAAALSPLILSLHGQVRDLVSSPVGLTILADAAREVSLRENDESLRVVSSRWRRRLGERDVRAAVLCAIAGEQLPQDNAILLLGQGDSEAIASLIRDVACHPFLASLVAGLLASNPRPPAEIAAALHTEPETSAAGLLQLAPGLPPAVLMQLASPLLAQCSPTVAARLATELHERGCAWTLSAIAAALANASPTVNAIALMHARDHDEPEVAQLLARFFCGELGVASGRRGFESAAAAWAGTGPDRRRRLMSLTMFLLRAWTPRISTRAWWSFRLMLRSQNRPIVPPSQSTPKGS